jgi:predicted MFS family arabinose efflux permease
LKYPARFPLSFGVFQNYLSHLPQYADQPYVAVIGPIASGISYMGAPIIIPWLKRTAKYRKYMIWFGWSMCIIGVLASSFATTLGAIVFTQGVMYGLGFTIFYYPVLDMVNEYWVVRRGMAYGLLCSASGVAGVVMPFSLEAMLNRYGYSTTLRAVAVALVVSTAPLIFFIKGRGQISQPGELGVDWGFLRIPLFWIYLGSTVVQGFGFFFPSLYLPSFASALGLGSRNGALLLAMMSVAQVFGQFSYGYLSDRRLSINVLTSASAVVSSIAVLALWGLAQNLAVLCVFAILYGFFAAGFTALWGRMGTAVSTDSSSAFAAFGLFNFGKGIGNVLAGPISAAMLIHEIDTSDYAIDRYKEIVLFCGSCMAASGVVAAAAYWKPWKASSR